MFPIYKLSRENTQPENMCVIISEKLKGHGGTVNWTSVYAEADVRGVFLKECYEKFLKIPKKPLFVCFIICNFIKNKSFLLKLAKFVGTPFLQNTIGWLLLIIAAAVSIAMKGEFANKTVSYGTKTKAYVPVWAGSESYYKGQSRWNNKFQKQSFAGFKLGVVKKFVNSTGEPLCWGFFLI